MPDFDVYADVPETSMLIPVIRLSKDLREAAEKMTEQEARYLVDAYYQMQDVRIRAAGQVREMEKTGEPTAILEWLLAQFSTLEKQVAGGLDRYSGAHPVGQWMRSQKGIGPVISAGFLAHLDIHRAPTYGHFHSYCGIHPDVKWEKGQKRPFNAAMKRLCFLVGESFVKVKRFDDAVYGHLYEQRKLYEQKRNEAGVYKDQAEAGAKRVSKSTEAYKHYSKGVLPPGHIHSRVRRWTAKMFLIDLHTVWYWIEYGRLPPVPYPHAHQPGMHAHVRWPPNHEMVPGLTEALKGWRMPEVKPYE